MVAVDETVRVLDGAFAGFAGRVASVNASSGIVVVNVPIFGRETPVEVAVESVEPAEEHPGSTPGPTQFDPTAILDEE